MIQLGSASSRSRGNPSHSLLARECNEVFLRPLEVASNTHPLGAIWIFQIRPIKPKLGISKVCWIHYNFVKWACANFVIMQISWPTNNRYSFIYAKIKEEAHALTNRLCISNTPNLVFSFTMGSQKCHRLLLFFAERSSHPDSSTFLLSPLWLLMISFYRTWKVVAWRFNWNRAEKMLTLCKFFSEDKLIVSDINCFYVSRQTEVRKAKSWWNFYEKHKCCLETLWLSW